MVNFYYDLKMIVPITELFKRKEKRKQNKLEKHFNLVEVDRMAIPLTSRTILAGNAIIK